MIERRKGRGRIATLLLLLLLLAACGGAAATPPAPQPSDEPPPETPTSEPIAEVPSPTSGGATASAAPAALASTVPVAPSASAVVPPALGVPATPPTAASTPRPKTTSPLATHRMITYYGHPASNRMGILGEFEPEQMVAKLQAQTASYNAADPSRPSICTIELIASVAQGSPGEKGLWLLRTSTKDIEKYAQLAEVHGCLLLLDIQMGYDTVANDVKALIPFLKRPYVHLAIDPEFHVKQGQIPGEHYGSVSAAEVLGAAQILRDLVRENNLPDKVLVIHQFRDDMLPDKGNITPVANVDIVIMMDGWGLPGAKVANYNQFIRDELIQYGGIKLFYRQDDPLLSPQEVVKLDPSPLIVVYQ